MSDNSYGRDTTYGKTEAGMPEISDDLRNDLLVAFNLYKNEEGFINKLKLRTLLFSFAMYKSSPKEINDYIAYYYQKKDQFSYENLIKLVSYKLYNFNLIY